MLLLLFLFYVVCMVFSFGFIYGYLQLEWPRLAEKDRKGDIRMSLCISLFGPMAMILILLNGDYKHGLLFPWSE